MKEDSRRGVFVSFWSESLADVIEFLKVHDYKDTALIEHMEMLLKGGKKSGFCYVGWLPALVEVLWEEYGKTIRWITLFVLAAVNLIMWKLI